MTGDRPPVPKDGRIRHSFDVLHGLHREILHRAIYRVISTETAKITYAQILDGLPIRAVAHDASGRRPYGDHPINWAHEELCPGIMDKMHEFGNSFSPDRTLKFDATLLFQYQAAAPGSRSFRTRLIELVARSIHQIAVLIFRLDQSLHKEDGIISWAPPKSDDFYWSKNPNGPLPTLFVHPWYKDYQQYPEGVADMVGYWAEARILGGVVLFDRRNPESDDIYWHPNRENVTYRIFMLLPEQKQTLLHFLTSNDSSLPSPLPILGDKNNRVRIDPEEPIQDTGIYRDLWERKELPLGAPDRRLRDVYDDHGVDYVSFADYNVSSNRAFERRDRYLYGDDADAWESASDDDRRP